MTESIEGKMRTGIGIKSGIRWDLWLSVSLVLAIACVLFVLWINQEAYVILPPHQIAVKEEAYMLMKRFEEAIPLFASDWPDKMMETIKKINTRFEPLEAELGPVEIRENETFDEATRVVVPFLSKKEKNLSTGKVKVLPDQEVADLLLEKQETPEGKRWLIIATLDPRYAEIESTWLNLPRKKVPRSPTIILKKEANSVVTMQIIYNGKVMSEGTVPWDEWGSDEDRDEKENESLNTKNIEKSGNTVEEQIR
jgi:hypothetical protein